jgi:O-antigen ligase
MPATSPHLLKIANWLRRYAGCLLVLATLVLFTTKALFNWPLAAMVVWGLVRLMRDPGAAIRDADLRVLLLLFVCLWLPMMLSLIDAVNLQRAFKSTAWYPRFFLAGFFIVTELRDQTKQRLVLIGAVVIIAFWCIDGVIQYVNGKNLFGYPMEWVQVTGMFYPMPRLGIVTATLIPVYFEGIRRLAGRPLWAGLLILPVLVAVYLSNNRNAWLSLFVASLIFGAWLATIGQRLHVAKLAVTALLTCVLVGGLAATNSWFQHRLIVTAGLFSGDYQRMDQATSYRLSLWRTAAAVARENPLNGVGPRGYRFVYEDYAHDRDFWLERFGKGQTHPHQQFLEIAAETGLPGVLGYGLFLLLVIGALRGSAQPAFLLGTLVASFPLNAHLAFYGTYWSTLLWWLLPIGLAGYKGRPRP